MMEDKEALAIDIKE